METPKPYKRGLSIQPEAWNEKTRNYRKGERGFSRVDEARGVQKIVRLTSTQENAIKDFCRKRGISFSALVRASIAHEMKRAGYILEVEDDPRQGNLFKEDNGTE